MTPDPEAFLAPLRRLTAREREVLHLDCQGRTAEEIAEQLVIGERTVYGHLQRIYAKLGLVEERDNLRQRKLVFFCLALPQLDPANAAAEAGSTPPPKPPEDEPAAPAAFERDRAAIVRWRQGELQGPDGPVPPAGDPAGGADTPRPPSRLVLLGAGAGAPPSPRGRPSWRLLMVVAVLAALLGGGVTALSLSRGSHAMPLAMLASPTPVASTPTLPATLTSAPITGSATAGTSVLATTTPRPAGTSTPGASVGGTAGPPANVRPTSSAAPTDLAGTPLQPGNAVTSVVDQATKPRDVYALPVQAGQTLQVTVTATSSAYGVTLDPPGALSGAGSAFLCTSTQNCTATLPIAAAGTDLLVLQAYGPGIRYTLRTATVPLGVGPGVTDLAGTVANDLPGTPLGLGKTVTSVIDAATKRRDVYAVALRAGQTLQVDTDATRSDYSVLLLPPTATTVSQVLGAFQGTTICANEQACHQTAPIAASNTYTLVVDAFGSAVQYTLHLTAQ